MKQRTLRRIVALTDRFTPAPGCPTCRAWPSIWIVGVDDPEPPVNCAVCGRPFSCMSLVYISVRLDLV